jgi:hypothetical protein
MAASASNEIARDQELLIPATGASSTRIREEDLELIAHWMDRVFRIPGINIRFGLDVLVGLIPGLGDTATSFVSLYILQAASQAGVPRVTVARMALNIALDYIVGIVPIVGDMFDVYWKANVRNVELMRRHARANPEQERRLEWSDRLFVFGLMALLVLILVGSIVAAWAVLAWIWRVIF